MRRSAASSIRSAWPCVRAYDGGRIGARTRSSPVASLGGNRSSGALDDGVTGVQYSLCRTAGTLRLVARKQLRPGRGCGMRNSERGGWQRGGARVDSIPRAAPDGVGQGVHEVVPAPPGASLGAERVDRLIGRDGFAVRTRCRQGIVDVDQPDDLRQQGNLVAAQAIGIPGAVEVFVMVAHDRADRPERPEILTQRVADCRVGPDELALLWTERTRFVEDGIRNGEHANV